MNTEILNKTNYLKATTLEDALKPLMANIERLRPTIATLSKADTRFSGLDQLYLTGLSALSELEQTLQAVTIDDKQQAEYRGMRELSHLCTARLYQIPSEIAAKRQLFSGAKNNHAAALKDLQTRGFKPEQIDRIMLETPAPDEEAHHAEIAALEFEQSKLNAFVSDFPVYDQSVLIGTRFEHWSKDSLNLGMSALAKLCAERVVALQDKVEWSRKKFKLDTYDFKKGMSHQPDEAAHILYVSQLEVEADKLNAFTKSSENWDKTLLIGTVYENWEPEALAV